METNELFNYFLTALGGGGVTQLFNWRINKRKGNSEAKAMEIKNIKDVVDSIYLPLIDRLDARIKDLEAQVHQMSKEVEEEHRQNDELRKQVRSLQEELEEAKKKH